MNRVALQFQKLKETKKKALIPYIMGGDPNLASLPRLLEVLNKAGADLIEVGVPFSDPLADGSVIQAAAVRALQQGCTLTKLLATLQPVTSDLSAPLILMIYYNQILQRGVKRFVEEVKAAGCAGLIIPDLPPEAAGELRELAGAAEIALNFLTTPTSKPARIKAAAEASTGFLYAVTVKGVTGVRNSLPLDLPDFLSRVKSISQCPVAVGFGIATPEQARMVAGLADGVIVGSALVQTIAADPSFKEAELLTRQLRG